MHGLVLHGNLDARIAQAVGSESAIRAGAVTEFAPILRIPATQSAARNSLKDSTWR
jgi:hypothetical protein